MESPRERARRSVSFYAFAGDVRGVVGCRALLEQLDPLYLAPSKATPSKLKAIVDDVRDAYAAAESNLGDDFSFLDESDVCDCVLKAILTCPTSTSTLAGPEDFLKYASRRVLDLAGAGELREAIFVRLVTQESIPIVRRQSLQLASLRHSCRSEASRQYLGCAVGLVVTGPQSSHHHHLLARGAWDEVSRGRPITMSLIDEALVTAAQELYQKATAAAEGLGRRLDAARGLQAGTGENRRTAVPNSPASLTMWLLPEARLCAPCPAPPAPWRSRVRRRSLRRA